MKQFEFSIISKRTGRADHVRATARSAEIARAHIVSEYGSAYTVADLFCDIHAPHQFAGEIDCTSALAEKFALWFIAQGGAA